MTPELVTVLSEIGHSGGFELEGEDDKVSAKTVQCAVSLKLSGGGCLKHGPGDQMNHQ